MSNLVASVALLRGLHLAATLSLLGTVGFMAWILPSCSVVPKSLHDLLTRLQWISGLIALLAGAAWFMLQAALIADADILSDALAAMPVVAANTRFGNILLVRLGLLSGAILLGLPSRISLKGLTWRNGVTLLVTATALSLQGMIGHVGATPGIIGSGLVLSEALHLLAAGFWLGALPPLFMCLRLLPQAQAAAVYERFSPIGLGCVLVLASTGFAQGVELIGSLPALLGTPYGHIALLKIGLFLTALVAAVGNRLWLTDRLAVGGMAARWTMLMSVGVETGVGAAIVLAAGYLASTMPGVHDTPVWPFTWRFSLVTVNQDPEFKQELVVSLLLTGGTTLLLLGALLLRRFRLVTCAAVAAAVILRASSLTLLTVEAYPTSFQVSPTGFAAASIDRGATVYASNCVACHGVDGQGNGPAAASLPVKPADLTMPHLWEHTDGDLFWWLSHGIDEPGYGSVMPGFANSLSAEDRWALIDYIRAHNAGVALRDSLVGAMAIAEPAFSIVCPDIKANSIADLHGRVVHVVTSPIDAASPPETSGIALSLRRDDDVRPPPGSCVAAEPTAWRAFAVLADLPAERLAGTMFLIDADGWLRMVQRAAGEGGEQAREDLLAAERYVRENPVKQANGGDHGHQH